MIRTRLCLAALLVAAPLAAQSKAAKSVPLTAATGPVWPDEGPRTWTPRPTSTAITANDLRTRLYQFADDSMLGRRIGEPGNYKGTEYIAGEFKRLGLKPGGDNGGWFQELAYGPLGFDTSSARLTVGGSALDAKSDWIPLAPTAANGLASRADLTNIATVFAGRWGDNAVTLDPALFRDKVAVFTSTPVGAGHRVQSRSS